MRIPITPGGVPDLPVQSLVLLLRRPGAVFKRSYIVCQGVVALCAEDVNSPSRSALRFGGSEGRVSNEFEAVLAGRVEFRAIRDGAKASNTQFEWEAGWWRLRLEQTNEVRIRRTTGLIPAMRIRRDET